MRRQRFTATFADGTRRVILAYAASAAREHYERLGHAVVSVEKGDYRKQARAAERRARGGWRLNRAALAEAIEFLGLEKVVRVHTSSRYGGHEGHHRLRAVDASDRFLAVTVSAFDHAADAGHEIMMKTYLTPEEASRTLWHELCHAMQAEEAIRALPAPASPREMYDAWTTCSAAGKGLTYRRKPIEVEAREYEKFADEMPLALPLRNQ